jgi:fused signal recognition particle receptor
LNEDPSAQPSAEHRATPDPAAEPAGKTGLWNKLKRGLFMTHTEMLDRIGAAIEGRAVLDDATVADLEEALIASDLGVEISTTLVERLRQRARRGEDQDLQRLREHLRDEVARLLAQAPVAQELPAGPAVLLIVGVNGAGKTTTIAKLARREAALGHKVLLAAGDTFRAAAVEQLALWGERLGIDVVRQAAGADPAAVVFDALQAAQARGVDRLIVDTAGRLHTKSNLMAELAKIGRVVAREAPTWHKRTWLVLDATTGQNALAQAREFTKAVPVDGLVLTKLDGTAKGGVAVAVARELSVPILYLGVGEGADDLVEFDPASFARALVG